MKLFLIKYIGADGRLVHVEWGSKTDPKLGAFSMPLLIEANNPREAWQIAWARTADFVRRDLAPWDEPTNGRPHLEVSECLVVPRDLTFKVGDRVFVPKGTSLVIGSQESETNSHTFATVTSVYDPLLLITVDDKDALPEIQHEWNRDKGKPEGNTEVYFDQVHKSL